MPWVVAPDGTGAGVCAPLGVAAVPESGSGGAGALVRAAREPGGSSAGRDGVVVCFDDDGASVGAETGRSGEAGAGAV